MFGLRKLRAVGDRLMSAAVLITMSVDDLNPGQVFPAVAIAGCCCLVAAKVCRGRHAKKPSNQDSSKGAQVSDTRCRIYTLLLLVCLPHSDLLCSAVQHLHQLTVTV